MHLLATSGIFFAIAIVNLSKAYFNDRDMSKT